MGGDNLPETRIIRLEQRITDLESERDVWKAQCLNSEASRQLIAENAKLRACVELYADEKNWSNDGPTVKAVVFAKQCLEDLK